MFCLFGLLAFAAYSAYNRKPNVQNTQLSNSIDSLEIDTSSVTNEAEAKVKDNYDKEIRAMIDSVQRADRNADTVSTNQQARTDEEQQAQNTDANQPTDDNNNDQNQKSKKYTLSATRAYFYDESNENSRRSSFLAKWNSPELTALDENNGFIYVEFFTINGEITKGWLRKRDLKRIGD